MSEAPPFVWENAPSYDLHGSETLKMPDANPLQLTDKLLN